MRLKDKTDWGPGPWQDEPDVKRWVDEATGLNCLILRGPMGALCGYVGVTKEHPAFGMNYYPIEYDSASEDVEWWRRHITQRAEYKIADIRVHGGLTYAGTIKDHGEDIWWFGFDCSHAWDYSPGLTTFKIRHPDEIYRNIYYTTTEVEKLAQQLAAIKKEDHEQTRTSQEVEPGQPGAGEQ